MSRAIPRATLAPPAGRPSWIGGPGLPLVYLGWGRRDFARHPVPLHYDRGTTHYLLARGRLTLVGEGRQQALRAPAAVVVDADCAFGLRSGDGKPVEMAAWVWRAPPRAEALRPPAGGWRTYRLRPTALKPLLDAHARCREEVARADDHLPRALAALQDLAEIELARALRPVFAVDALRWRLARSWMTAHLALHNPVPSLCDYLRMSPSTLHRFFLRHAHAPPGACFRRLKLREARRLIRGEEWPVKRAALHLGYRHANDLSRALRAR